MRTDWTFASHSSTLYIEAVHQIPNFCTEHNSPGVARTTDNIQVTECQSHSCSKCTVPVLANTPPRCSSPNTPGGCISGRVNS